MSRLLHRLPLRSHRLLCTSVFIMLTAFVRAWFEPRPTEWLGRFVWSLFVFSQLLLALLLAWLLYHLCRRPHETPGPHETNLPA